MKRFTVIQDNTQKPLHLGRCCACQGTAGVRNLIMLHRKTPYGEGWGCLICGQPRLGAVTVLCDTCFEGKIEPAFFIKGPAENKDRAPIYELKEYFNHDLTFHPEVRRGRN
jgi:hypothetical protein